MAATVAAVPAAIAKAEAMPSAKTPCERAKTRTRMAPVQGRMPIAATTPAAERIYTDADLRGPLAVVMGSEQYGLSKFWLENCDVPVRIPMAGQADSLNVAMATIITLFEAVRQRDGGKT